MPRFRAWLLTLPLLFAAADAGAATRVLIETELGDILAMVAEESAPITAHNFLRQVRAGAYEGGTFYRVVRRSNQPDSPVKIEVIQGGLGWRAEGPYPPIAHETTEQTGLLHIDGALSMARSEPGTASSEFFICIGDQPELDFGGRRNPDGQGFATFGRVLEGMDVVRAIQAQATRQRGPDDDQLEGQMLAQPVRIISIRRADAPDVDAPSTDTAP